MTKGLFGDWTLITVSGRLGSRLGHVHSTAVPSHEHSLARFEEIAKGAGSMGIEALPKPRGPGLPLLDRHNLRPRPVSTQLQGWTPGNDEGQRLV